MLSQVKGLRVMEREDVILDMVARKDRSDKVIFNTVYGVGVEELGGGEHLPGRETASTKALRFAGK